MERFNNMTRIMQTLVSNVLTIGGDFYNVLPIQEAFRSLAEHGWFKVDPEMFSPSLKNYRDPLLKEWIGAFIEAPEGEGPFHRDLDEEARYLIHLLEVYRTHAPTAGPKPTRAEELDWLLGTSWFGKWNLVEGYFNSTPLFSALENRSSVPGLKININAYVEREENSSSYDGYRDLGTARAVIEISLDDNYRCICCGSKDCGFGPGHLGQVISLAKDLAKVSYELSSVGGGKTRFAWKGEKARAVKDPDCPGYSWALVPHNGWTMDF